ncbi:MAG: glycosyltransferase [Cyanobacteriota bacterium]|nr:glycosyltransferase [Cyanobacteriota bacterium]
MKIIVEGWRFISQSYAIVNQFQLLELLRRSNLELFHREMPYLCDWQPMTGLLVPEDEAKLRQISTPPPGEFADALLRMHMPFDLTPGNAKKTCVFGLTEHGIVQKEMLNLMGVKSLHQVHANTDTVIITSSQWSRTGFIESGANPDRTVVVPLGFDPKICYPLGQEERIHLRRKLGWDNHFIFLNVSAMNNRKGICPLLKAFAAATEKYPHARLVLKGTESLYSSRKSVLTGMKNTLTDREIERVVPRLAYIGEDYSFAEVAQLYQAADAYISPYLAEGFNLPVLEAIACGLPVICTRGGPTDDFTRSDFALPIESHQETMRINGEDRWIFNPNLEQTIELMGQAIEDNEFRARANRSGPEFVRNGYTWSQVVDKLLEVLVPEMTTTPSPTRQQTLQEKVASFPFWYHKIELPGGIVTPGGWPTEPEKFGIPQDLTGKRVLDVGAWDGYWTFEALKRGAAEVVAIDDFSDYLGRLETSDRRAWDTFDCCREAFGYDARQCQRTEISVYEVSEAKLGRFDVVFCFGTIYHLRYPLLALDKLAAICDGEIYVESSILDDFSPYRGGLGKGYGGGQMVMEFYPTDELHDNSTNYWSPTLACLGQLVKAAGFATVQVWKLSDRPAHLGMCRGFAMGRKKGIVEG